MKTLHFEAVIDAPRRTVWHTMLDLEPYERWTAAFAEGSTYEGSWDQGERIRFLDPQRNGMVAVIDENRSYEHVSIKHLGLLNNGVEDTESEAVRQWAPAYERYSFADAGANATRLSVDMDCVPEYEAFMLEAWPNALARLKALCES